jgi:hypothetical protein
MQAALHLTTTVRPGGTIEVTDSQLPAGEQVDLIVLFPQPDPARRSIVDVLSEAPGGVMFHTAEEVEQYLREERASWER